MKDNVWSAALLMCVVVAVVGVSGGIALGKKLGAKDNYDRGFQAAKVKYDKPNAAGKDISRLRVCINKTASKEEQTSCFRQYDAGVLPEPSIDDYNNLPDYY